MGKVSIVICVCLPFLLQADQVTLKNGDRITGAVVSSDEKTLILKTAAMGEVKIDGAAIRSFSSDEPLTVTLKRGNKLVGRVQAEEPRTLVTTANGTVQSVSHAEVQAIRTAAAQAAWDREEIRREHPPLDDFWSGTIGLNLASASGNAKTTTFGTGATAQRITGFDKIGLTYSQIYSTQSTIAPFGATANRISGGVRYDRNFGAKMFVFGLNSYDYDRFLDLDLRSVLGGGVGFHAYKTVAHWWDLGAGADWSREAFGTGLVRNSGELLFSEESGHQLTTIMKLFQRMTLFPNLSSGGDYRLNFDGGASFQLTKALSWNVTLTDRYLSNPLPGKKGNDVLLTTGIGITFEQK